MEPIIDKVRDFIDHHGMIAEKRPHSSVTFGGQGFHVPSERFLAAAKMSIHFEIGFSI